MKVRMEAGKYYIGDPCYAFNKTWDRLLEATNYLNSEHGDFEFEGFKGWSAGTMYGDGSYSDGKYDYPVDAGLIGVIPVEMLDLDRKLTPEKVVSQYMGRIVDFPESFTVERTDDGTFYIGDDIVIPTGDDDGDDYDEEDDYDDGDDYDEEDDYDDEDDDGD